MHRRVDEPDTDQRTFENTQAGIAQLVDWTAGHRPARIGLEPSGGVGHAAASDLAVQHVVVRVPPRLSCREAKTLRSRGKSDPTDAIAIARVAAREDRLPPFQVHGYTDDLKLLVDHRDQLHAERTRVCNRLHAHLAIAHPGYQREIGRQLTSKRSLDRVETFIAGDHDLRSDLAADALARLRALDLQIRTTADRIDTLIAARSDEDWDDLARRHVQELVDACQRGAQRGRELRDSRQDTEAEDGFDIGWLLRHPTDHWLRQAAPSVSDPQCQALIGTQVTKLAPSYQQLCDLDWTAEEAAADVICEIRVLGTPGRWIGWKEPMSAVVTTPVKGATSVDQQMAVRLVEDPDGPFNGTLVSLLACERWLLCARELADGTLLPLNGTRRLATPSP